MKRFIFLIFFFLPLSIINSAYSQTEPFLKRIHVNSSISSLDMPYRLCMPKDYDVNRSYPMVLFLHGAGERGTNNEAQLIANEGATIWAESLNQIDYPCFVVAPQCPADKQWVNTNWGAGSYNQDDIPMSDQLAMVIDILDSLQNEFKLDLSKQFVTGLSMGGYGTWDLISRYPNKFAAAIPICGAGDPSKAYLIATLPLRVFHSSDDGVVPVSGSRDMVNAIKGMEDNGREEFYTEYTNQGHASWINAYNTSGLVPWLFTASAIESNLCNNYATLLSISPSQINLGIGDTAMLTSVLSPVDACDSIIWSSDNNFIATVDTYGKVSAIDKGTTFITMSTQYGSKTAECSITVGVSSVHQGKIKGLTVFPNPTVDNIFITLTEEFIEGTITIYNVLGRIIETYIITDSTSVLSLANYQKGIYFVKVTTNETRTLTKILVE